MVNGKEFFGLNSQLIKALLVLPSKNNNVFLTKSRAIPSLPVSKIQVPA